MAFPEIDRVIYANNPLAEVICQVRFPRNFDIETTLPVAFQKTLAQEYPIFESKEILNLELLIANSQQSPEVQSTIKTNEYGFSSEDKQWRISLTRDSVSITTTKYNHWEDFIDRFEALLDALFSSYQIPIFERIGLRYRNIIDKEFLGAGDANWINLINKNVVGILADKSIDVARTESLQNVLSLHLEDCKVHIRSGTLQNTNTKKIAFALDNDFFIDEITKGDKDVILGTLGKFHDHSGRIFRWSISDSLHDLLQPTQP